MRPSLPPLTSLRAFEAAARHLSFSKAADELHVTPAAISHQIKALETAVGEPLFHRLTRTLQLTEAGQAAAPLLSEGFDTLARAMESIRALQDRRDLTISVSPSFGAMWLVPRLDRFRKSHPDIELRIDGTDRLVDVARGEADIAIRYGAGGYGDLTVDTLFAQVNTPVCSPSLRDGPHPIQVPQDLVHHTLLHVDWKEADASWRMWLLAAGADQVNAFAGPRFNQETMAVEAAVNGQGVALVGDRLVADHLATGRLVRPFGTQLSTPLHFAYHLVGAPNCLHNPRVAAFWSWARAEAVLDTPTA